ncbi:hypothetical protein POM88_012383 [Heracleum sosnowskyi]|uniref:Uncharacterized protein n=1 Tax=Heracleum sosnowskyi TaxID=360622 RepID=A0AAD8IZU8_9APIA|nr:hypothetical protein POM88_012383 [Heracleum sosnowskyi]
MIEVEEDDEMIPKYKFELAAFNTLKDKVGDTKILTDLMGLVQNRLPMQSRNTQTCPKDVLFFDISDGSSTVKVTVWADLAHNLNEELDGMLGQDNIIIITSYGITEYHEQLQASTLSPSKF